MKRKPLRIYISKVLCVFIFSFTLFYLFDIHFRIIAIIVVAAMALLVVASWKNRQHTFPKGAGFFAASLFAYSMEYVIIQHNLLQTNFISAVRFITRRMGWFDVVLSFGIVVFIIYSTWLVLHKKTVAPKVISVLSEQRYDIERLECYVRNFNITGINGVWGSGKSFLTEEFKRRNQNEYTFITIGLLHCNLDEILSLLLEEVDKVLLQNAILSSYSHKLKTALANTGFVDKITGIFMENTSSYASTLEDFKKEFAAVKRPILVILEDIDRISDDNVIKKIFSISEQLACEMIKFLYQYDQEELNTKELRREYTEKYIPYTVNVTPASFSTLLYHLHRELNINDELINASEDFRFTRLPIYPKLPYAINTKQQVSINMRINCRSVRKVEQFLRELEMSLQENTEYAKPSNKNVVITFYILKHFYYSLYEKIRVNTSLIDAFTLKCDGCEFTIIEMLALYKDKTENNIMNALTSPENNDVFGILCLLGYSFDINEETQGFDIYTNEPKEHMVIKNSNEKIDRLIWNLYASGTTEFTDYENAVREMAQMVLSKPNNEQEIAFKNFFKKFYEENMYKSGNLTIFRLGIPAYVSLFHAFSIACNDPDLWQKLVSLYFMSHPDIKIDSELISILNDCRVDYKKLYLDIIRRFIDIPIIGNLYRLKSYRKFLEHYLGAISRLGYIDNSDLAVWLGISSMIDRDNNPGAEDETKNILCNEILPNMKSKLDKLRHEITAQSPSASEDIDYLMRFIDKNIEILNNTRYIKSPEPHFSISNLSSRYINQEEFDRLRVFAKDDFDKYKKEIDNSYRLEKITAHEISKLPPCVNGALEMSDNN